MSLVPTTNPNTNQNNMSPSIILDTYSKYMMNPSHLLYKKKLKTCSSGSPYSYPPPPMSVPNVSHPSNPSSLNPCGAKPIKSLPLLALELAHQTLIDLEDFKDTNRSNPYTVSWKGILFYSSK